MYCDMYLSYCEIFIYVCVQNNYSLISVCLNRLIKSKICFISSTNFNAQFSLFINNMFAVCSQPVYCADVYRERRYQMLCEYNFSSLRWACWCSIHVEDNSVTNILLMNKENCALKLVDEIILYYDAWSTKHQTKICYYHGQCRFYKVQSYGYSTCF